jgi:hypothetical protein
MLVKGKAIARICNVYFVSEFFTSFPNFVSENFTSLCWSVRDTWSITVRMSDCCLQGIEPCKCKGKGHQWIGNQVFKQLGLRKE